VAIFWALSANASNTKGEGWALLDASVGGEFVEKT
jgi:hypothetical protein